MLTLAGLVLSAGTPASAAPNPSWAAKWEGQSAYLTLESGQIAESYFVARNVGSQTWERSFVRLGTVNEPLNFPDPARNSPFEVPGEWLTPSRPTTLDQDFVPPGQTGTFTFHVRAPDVGSRTDFIEHFAPVAEARGWMACQDSPSCQWSSAWLDYLVYPAQDPVLSIAPGSRAVTAGDPLHVAAEASDNVGLNRVVFSLEGQEVTDDSAPYEASFSTASLPPGGHVVTVHAYDNAGHSATDVASYSIAAAAEPENGVGVTIEGGRVYTNNPNVQLTLRPPSNATGATISNDGLANPSSIALTGGDQAVPWRLASSGPERLPKTVYVHFTGGGVDASKQHTDDIILDETPPTLAAVQVVAQRRGNRKPLLKGRSVVKGHCSRKPLMLKVKAHDKTSGISTLSYSFKPRTLGRTLSFKPSVALKLPPKPSLPRAVFVHVRDGALNLSKVRKVSLRNACG